MAVVISIPFLEPWMVSNWSFRLLAERTKAQLVLDEDKHEMDVAAAMGGLHFDLKDPETAQRLSIALTRAAMVLQGEISAAMSDDPRDQELTELLDTIVMHLTELRGEGS